MKSKLGAKIAQGLQDHLDFLQGKGTARVTRITRVGEVEVPPNPPEYTGERIRQIREEMNLSQAAFGQFLLVSKRTVESWEHNHRRPTRSACRLLQKVEDPTLLQRYRVNPKRSHGTKAHAQ